MSLIALALTLCTAVGNNDEACNTYMIDTFAQPQAQSVSVLKPNTVFDQWLDCVGRMGEEMDSASIASKYDRKYGVTNAREYYLNRFNIKQDVKSIDTWEYSCVVLNEQEVP